ncbi:hypothetical protein F3D3_3204 [Fusibacter sp. 3D3]|nr:hypothetical protein F3D3_3204 [Fusibacter sp. 3D3]
MIKTVLRGGRGCKLSDLLDEQKYQKRIIGKIMQSYDVNKSDITLEEMSPTFQSGGSYS